MKRKYLFSMVLVFLIFAILINGFYQSSEKNHKNNLPLGTPIKTTLKTAPNSALNTDPNPASKQKHQRTAAQIKPPEPAKEDPATAVSGEISIKLKSGQDINNIPALKDKIKNVQSGYVYTSVSLKPGVDANKVLAEVQKDDRVEVAGSVHKYYPSATFDDTSYPSQWYMPKINAPTAYDNATGLQPIKVAVIDTGVSGTHPDLASKIVAEYSVTQPAGPGVAHPTPTQGTFHGTHVAGIIAAQANNGTGIAGVSPNAQIMAVQVARDTTGMMWDFDIADGMYWAVDHGAKVINLSLGGDYSVNIHYAVNWALSHGVVVVAAAGNNNGLVSYPAALPGVIAVAATDSNDNKASFSNFGPEITVAAPGVNIMSTYWDSISGDGYASASGTSMAAPMVTGEIATMLGSYPSLTNSQIADILEQNSVDLGTPGKDNYFGYGRIDMKPSIWPMRMNIDSPGNGNVVRGLVTVSGWALNSSNISAVYMLKNDWSYLGAATIGLSRPDVAGAYPGYANGSQSGFSYTLDTTVMPNGWQTIRVVPTGSDGIQMAMSISIYIDNPPMRMNIDSPGNGNTVSGTVSISGWALNASDLMAVYVLRGDWSYLGSATIGLSRPDVNGAFPGYISGSQSGFTYNLDTTKLPDGWQTLWVVPTGRNGAQTAMRVTIYVNNPMRMNVESMGNGSVIRGQVPLSGWALSPADMAAVYVLRGDWSYLGTATIGYSRPDVNGAFPGYPSGSQSGYSYTLDTTKLPNGWQTLRVVPTGRNGAQMAMSLNVYVDNPSMRMNIDSPGNGNIVSGTVSISGWALNASDIAAVYVLRGDWSYLGTATKGLSRPDVNGAFPGYPGGSQSGYIYTLDTTRLPNGWQTIRVVPTGNNGNQMVMSIRVFVAN